MATTQTILIPAAKKAIVDLRGTPVPFGWALHPLGAPVLEVMFTLSDDLATARWLSHAEYPEVSSPAAVSEDTPLRALCFANQGSDATQPDAVLEMAIGAGVPVLMEDV